MSTAHPTGRQHTSDTGDTGAEAVADWLVACIADYREVPVTDIGQDVPLAELGLDSVYALTLCGDIEERWGVETDPTVAWDHPTIDALAAHLHGRLLTDGVGG